MVTGSRGAVNVLKRGKLASLQSLSQPLPAGPQGLKEATNLSRLNYGGPAGRANEAPSHK